MRAAAGWPRAVIACLLGACFVAPAAAENFILPKAETRPLAQRASNGRDYLLHVGFPLSYETAGAARRYPVVYLLDAYWDFPAVALAADFVRRDGHAPETIVVGIGYGGTDPDVGLLRQSDLTPGLDEEYDPLGEKTGQADAFLTVLEREIIPFVERTYRADPSHRVLVGHSFGGLFALYTAFQRPALFRGVVAASPALYWRNEYILELARAHAASGAGLGMRLFVGWGSNDGEKLRGPVARFVQEVGTLGIPSLRMAAREIAGGGHSGAKPETFTRGLRFVFAPQAWVPTVGEDPGYGETGRFTNLSTRGRVDGSQALIGGFVVRGLASKRVLVRAAGPALTRFGVAGAVANPRLRVVAFDGRTIAENDDWGQVGADAEGIMAAGENVGAFALTPGSRDAALVLTLDPGQYTVIVEGGDGSAGVALVEAYEVP